jgi:hypothetical protein
VAANGHADDTRVVSSSVLGRFLDWLRAGYPEGVPGPDRVPLLALLRATPLTEDQVNEVVRNLMANGAAVTEDGELDADVIAAFIEDVTQHDAGPENVRRVADRLAATGWPQPGADDDTQTNTEPNTEPNTEQ